MLSEQTPAAPVAEQPAPVAAPVTAPAVERPETASQHTEGSLAEHEAAVERARDEKGQFTKHRSSKQRASVEDVPRIAELTKNWRTTEERAVKAEKELAELREQLKPKPATPQLKAIPKVESKTFEKPEPKIDDFANESDPYLAYVEARQDWRLEKREFDKAQEHSKQEAESAQTHNREQLQTFFQDRARDFGSRLDALIDAQADAKALLSGIEQIPLSNVMHAAFMLHPQGEQLMLQIARAKDRFADRMEDLAFDTSDKPVTHANVEAIQRRLSRWLQDATTGSSAPVPKQVFAPRPPSPVRTVAMKTADTPPSDDSSLAEHESFYGRK